MELLALANSKGYDYCHIISENTLPICTKEQMEAFFSDSSNVYMESIPSLLQDPDALRTRYFYFQHLINTKRYVLNYFEKCLVTVQKLLRINRRFRPLYKGYLYCHLNRQFVVWLTQNEVIWKNYLKKLKYCYGGEEYFFQNLLEQSPYRNSLVNDCLIFDIWDQPQRGQPANLMQNDISSILKSKKLFARKFSTREKEMSDFFKDNFIKALVIDKK